MRVDQTTCAPHMPQSPPAETSTKQSGHIARVGRSVTGVGFGDAVRRSERGADARAFLSSIGAGGAGAGAGLCASQ